MLINRVNRPKTLALYSSFQDFYGTNDFIKQTSVFKQSGLIFPLLNYDVENCLFQNLANSCIYLNSTYSATKLYIEKTFFTNNFSPTGGVALKMFDESQSVQIHVCSTYATTSYYFLHCSSRVSRGFNFANHLNESTFANNDGNNGQGVVSSNQRGNIIVNAINNSYNTGRHPGLHIFDSTGIAVAKYSAYLQNGNYLEYVITNEIGKAHFHHLNVISNKVGLWPLIASLKVGNSLNIEDSIICDNDVKSQIFNAYDY